MVSQVFDQGIASDKSFAPVLQRVKVCYEDVIAQVSKVGLPQSANPQSAKIE